MKKLVVPALLAAVAAVQLIRIEYVAAVEKSSAPTLASALAPSQPSAEADGSSGGETPPLAIDAAVAAPPVLARPAAARWSSSPSPKRMLADDPYGADYIIEPPDVIDIEVQCDKLKAGVTLQPQWGQLPSSISIEAVVPMDGVLELGPFGKKVKLAGKTIAEAQRMIEQKLAEVINKPAVTLTVTASNSKVAYVVFQGFGPNPRTSSVARIALRYPLEESNVAWILGASPLPTPLDWSKAEVTIARPNPVANAAEEKLSVVIDPKTGKPTPETNQAVLPGDRIFVDAGDANPVVQEYPVTEYQAINPASPRVATSWNPRPPVAPPTTSATPAYNRPMPAPPHPAGEPQLERAVPGTDQVVYSITILKDTTSSLYEFPGLRDKGFMIADGETLRGTLAILQKNKLVKTVADPSIFSAVDGSAGFSIGEKDVEPPVVGPTGEIRAAAVARPQLAFYVRSSIVDGKLRCSFTADAIYDGRRLKLGVYDGRAIRVGGNHDLARGQSIVVRFADVAAGADVAADAPRRAAAPKPDYYAVITPTLGQLSPTPATSAFGTPYPAAPYSAPAELRPYPATSGPVDSILTPPEVYPAR